jgi:iron(III) transport system substrate-binding protein
MYGWASAICFNTIEAKKGNVPKPVKWADLTQPAYKGKVTMPNPASSGTGLLMVNAWIQMWGEEKAWAFMDKLHENIASYSHSGDKPCEQAGAGEHVVGLSFPLRAAKVKTAGAPIDIIIAEEGTGWDMQASGIMKTTKNMDDAKVLMDWAISSEAMELYGQNYEVTALPVKVAKLEHVPANIADKMIKADFNWIAKEQGRVVAEWRKRYDTKSEPKK